MNTWPHGVARELRLAASLSLPRLLTQVCRDPGSAHYGCFDRDWWHYRIRDFPSIILQQGGYALWVAAGLADHHHHQESLRHLAAASCRFWNRRALRRGAFEEYYPWEEGYPPLAFSTLAVMKLAAAGAIPPTEVLPGAKTACRQLLSRFEAEATNQQVAGLAALAWGRRLFPDLVPGEVFEALCGRTLGLQHEEGWFKEYGGPDLGYLSVTLDCLWDLYDATGHPQWLAPIERAVHYIALLTSIMPGRSVGMHNARNTDYLLPYGLVRAALQPTVVGGVARRLGGRFFGQLSSPAHFWHAMDDRYLSHYAGASLFRAAQCLESGPAQAQSAEPEEDALPTESQRLLQSGHVLRRSDKGHSLLITVRKGGIFSICHGEGVASDFGWVVQVGRRQFITHWWSDEWRHRLEAGRCEVEGVLYAHAEVESSPLGHFLLRSLSFMLGRRLIQALKQRLIFRKRPSAIRFCRTIDWSAELLRVTDRFQGLPPGAEVRPAPRSSKRHVASADTFHFEDLEPFRGFAVSRERRVPAPGTLEVATVYSETQR